MNIFLKSFFCAIVLAMMSMPALAGDGYFGFLAPSGEAPRSKGGYSGFIVWEEEQEAFGNAGGYSPYAPGTSPIITPNVYEERRAAIEQRQLLEQQRQEAERRNLEQQLTAEFEQSIKVRDEALSRIQAEALRAEQAMIKERARLEAQARKNQPEAGILR